LLGFSRQPSRQLSGGQKTHQLFKSLRLTASHPDLDNGTEFAYHIDSKTIDATISVMLMRLAEGGIENSIGSYASSLPRKTDLTTSLIVACSQCSVLYHSKKCLNYKLRLRSSPVTCCTSNVNPPTAFAGMTEAHVNSSPDRTCTCISEEA